MFYDELATGVKVVGNSSKRAFRFQEETVTETMLCHMNLLFGDVLEIEMFDRRAEAQYGADWLWVLDFGAKQYLMVVQAKKLDGPWNGTMSWTATIDSAQRSNLIQVARAQRVDPYYCFYGPLAATARCTGPLSKMNFVNFVAANAVGDKERSSSLRTKAASLEALFCCPSGPEDARALLKPALKGIDVGGASHDELDSLRFRKRRSVENALREARTYAGTVLVRLTSRRTEQ